MKQITLFKGNYSFLSNFFPVHINHLNLWFTCVEAAYMASKCADQTQRKMFMGLNGGQAKRLGRTITLRSDWETVKLEVMEQLVRQKFQYQLLKEKLLETEDAILIEGNYWHDNFWGSCTCAKCGNRGQNNLGKILMKIREELKS